MIRKTVRVVTLVFFAMGLVNSLHAEAVLLDDGGLKPQKENRKLDFLFKASNAYLLGGTTFDMVTTVQGINHSTVASRTDGSVLATYHGREAGWARMFGARNTGAVVAANVGLAVATSFVATKLYRKGGYWRILGIGLNLYKGTDSFMSGAHNMGVMANIDHSVRQRTGYGGRIIWSH
jgi:hypothetical protein